MASSSSSSYYGEPSELEVEITICSANILKGYYTDPLYTYAVTWVCTNRNEKCQTSIDTSGDTDPTWNDKFVIPLRAATVDQTTLFIKISDYAKQDDAGVDVIIGSLSLPLCEVGISKQAQRKKMELFNLSGYPRGNLEFQVMVRKRLQGGEDYTLQPPPPLRTFNPPSTPPPSPPLHTFNPPSAPPLQRLLTFKDYFPPSTPPHEDNFTPPSYSRPLIPPPTAAKYPRNSHPHSKGGICSYCQQQQLPYWEQSNVIGTVFVVGVGIGLVCGIVLGLNPEMLERVLVLMVFLLLIYFGFLMMSWCTCEE